MFTHVRIRSGNSVFTLCPNYLATYLNQVCHLPTDSLRRDDTLNPLLSHTASRHSSYHLDSVSSPLKLAQKHLCLCHRLNTECLRNRGSEKYFDMNNKIIHSNQNSIHEEIKRILNPIHFLNICLYVCCVVRWRFEYVKQYFSLHVDLRLRLSGRPAQTFVWCGQFWRNLVSMLATRNSIYRLSDDDVNV
jgi:hypothetical protein